MEKRLVYDIYYTDNHSYILVGKFVSLDLCSFKKQKNTGKCK